MGSRGDSGASGSDAGFENMKNQEHYLIQEKKMILRQRMFIQRARCLILKIKWGQVTTPWLEEFYLDH